MIGRVIEFYFSTVKPSVDEFYSNCYSIRRGRVAAIMLSHMTDYWLIEVAAQPQTKDALKQLHASLAAECPDFSLVRDVADASKHDLLVRKKRSLTSSDQIARSPGLFESPLGDAMFGEASVVIVTLDDGKSRPLLGIIRSVANMWEAKLTRPFPQSP